jgi:response regulator of citrate/malate metabolism
MKPLEQILLVDDDEATNFFHSKVISTVAPNKKVTIALNGEKGLRFFHHKKTISPTLILLDINMPKTNGWDFLNGFQKLSDEIKENVAIVMLTTSVNPNDKLKAEKYKVVKDFLIKPLTTHILETTICKFFDLNRTFISPGT